MIARPTKTPEAVPPQSARPAIIADDADTGTTAKNIEDDCAAKANRPNRSASLTAGQITG